MAKSLMSFANDADKNDNATQVSVAKTINFNEMYGPGIWWCGFCMNLEGSSAHHKQALPQRDPLLDDCGIKPNSLGRFLLSHEVATAHGFRPQLQVFVEPCRLQPRDEGLPIRLSPTIVLGGCDLESQFEPRLCKLLLDLTVDLGGPEACLHRQVGLERALNAGGGEGGGDIIGDAAHALEHTVAAGPMTRKGYAVVVHVMQVVMHSGPVASRMVDDH